jgi:hypothetical protein
MKGNGASSSWETRWPRTCSARPRTPGSKTVMLGNSPFLVRHAKTKTRDSSYNGIQPGAHSRPRISR